MSSLGLGGGNFFPEIGNQTYPYPIKFWNRTGIWEYQFPIGNNRKQEGNFEETRPNWARKVRGLIIDMGQSNRKYENVGFYIPEKRKEKEKEEKI